MELLTDILREEAARRETACRYEKATNDLAHVRRKLPRLDAPIKVHQTQIALLDRAIAAVQQLDGRITGLGGYRAAEVILNHLNYVRVDQARKLADLEAKRVALLEQLPRLEAAVKDLA